MTNQEGRSVNQSVRNLTYMPWIEHCRDFFVDQWKGLLLYTVALFGIFWGLIEAISFFYPNSQLNNGLVLIIVIVGCVVSSCVRCVYVYQNTIRKGLENESTKAQKVAFSQKPFWEYALAYELLKTRISKIDQELDDVLNNRIHIKVTKTMDAIQYIEWMKTRPENLLRLVDVSKQLLIFDLLESIHAGEDNNVDIYKLIRVVDLVKNAYKNAYEFEIEGREIKVPEGFCLVHEIQSGWASVIRDGFVQMLGLLLSVSKREKDDFSPLQETITFGSPPRMDEFLLEMERISQSFYTDS